MQGSWEAKKACQKVNCRHQFIHVPSSKWDASAEGKKFGEESQRDQRHASIIIHLNFEREKSAKLSFKMERKIGRNEIGTSNEGNHGKKEWKIVTCDQLKFQVSTQNLQKEKS